MEQIDTSTGCRVCAKPLSAVNRTGYCRAHYGAVNNGARAGEQMRRQWADPATRALLSDAIRRRNRQRTAWLPLEYRPLYLMLLRKVKMLASEARAEVEAQIAADADRYARTGMLQQSRRAS